MYRQSTRKRKLTKEQKIKMFYQFNSFHQKNTKPQKLKVISSLNLRLITPLLTPSNHSDFFLILTGEYEHKSVSNHHDS